MSFRGRTLIVNNLVASLLWHRLTCIDPPPGLLTKLQEKLVNFFWGGRHWVPQGVLFLPREEGGQGLIHLASRTATFRVQFIQRFLTGPADLVWREVAGCILRRVGNLGLGESLFLTDPKFLKMNGATPFYQGIFKSWALFKCSVKCSNSLFWLLREPLVCGARLDVCSGATPGLMTALCRTKTLVLQQLVDTAGPALADARAVGSLLGIRSARVAQRLLELWRSRLSGRERCLLVQYGRETEPNITDPFPELSMVPQLDDSSGPLLTPTKQLDLHTADKKTIYKVCVKITNRSSLCDRAPSVWTGRLREGAAPHWRVLYKPPLRKKTADLQWRILHGAIACNSFLSIIDPAVSSQCPFCHLHENVFHMFSDCNRLNVFFALLHSVFALFREKMTTTTFIYGAGYTKGEREKWQLLNFICGEAKLAIYISRKNKREGRAGQEAASVWRCNTRCRLRVEFAFYRMIRDLESFKNIWCYDNILCSVREGRLHLADFLKEQLPHQDTHF